MKQPTKSKKEPAKKRTVSRKKPITVGELIKKRQKCSERKHPKYGTSKLEDRFASEFLDRLGLRYQRQYEAKDIGRFYDFAVLTESGFLVLIECDGDFYHGYGLIHEDKNPMQKHNEWVDKVKDEWAREHGIPLIRIWEHDINSNQTKVMKMLRTKLTDYDDREKRKKGRKNGNKQ